MEFKKIWIAPGPGQKNRYALFTLGSVVAIVFLIMVLVVGGTFLTLYLSLPTQASLVGLCIGAVLLGVLLAVNAGRRALRDTLVFFLTQDDRLFVLDARTIPAYRRGPWGFGSMVLDAQKVLDRLAHTTALPPQAREILWVEKIQEGSACCRVTCQIRRPQGGQGRWVYLVPSGYPEEDLLRFQLERRMERPRDREC